MSTIPENGLPTEVSTDVEEMQAMFMRLLDATGRSKRKLISQILLKIANIYGLQTSLDSKIALKTTGFPDRIAKFLTNGDIDISNFGIGSFSSLALLDAYDVNGFAVAEGTGSEYVHPIMGTITSLILMNNQEFIFTSDRGIWFRTNTGSSWTYPVYVGGAAQNIVVTYAEAEALVADGSLSVGAVYSIEDFDVTGYTKIILTAATPSTFYDNGVAFLPVPKYKVGDVSPDLGGAIGIVEFFPEWHLAEVIEPTLYTYAATYVHGRVYITESGPGGAIGGTLTDWVPDDEFFIYMSPTIYPELYDTVQHSVLYDFTANFVRSETSKEGVTATEGAPQEDLYQTRYNDWNVIFGTNIKCRRFYGMESAYTQGIATINTMKNIDISGDLFNISCMGHPGMTSYIDGVYGVGSLKNIKLFNVILSVDLYANAVLDGLNVLEGQPYQMAHISLYNKTVTYGERTEGEYIPSQVSIADLYSADETNNKIACALTVGAGTFTITTSWAEGSIVTGCDVTVDRQVGITADYSYGRFTVPISGWYELSMQTSATVSAAATIEVMAYKNDTTAIPQWYNKKRYATNDSWQVSTLPSYPVQLDAGDVVTFKYLSTSNVTVTLGQINRSLKYDG